MIRLVLVAFVVVAFSTGAATAHADKGHGGGGGGDEVRIAGDCGGAVTSSLRLRAHDQGIEVRFRLRQTRGRGVWRITVVHEQRVSFRAKRRTTRSEDSFEVRRTIPDLQGSDTIAVHAWGPRGRSCRATATLVPAPAA